MTQVDDKWFKLNQYFLHCTVRAASSLANELAKPISVEAFSMSDT